MLEISAWLHVPNQVNPSAGASLKHLEDKNLVRLVILAWIALDIGPCVYTSKLNDAIHYTYL